MQTPESETTPPVKKKRGHSKGTKLNTNHDWEHMRHDYIYGFVDKNGTVIAKPSAREVALHHGEAERTVILKATTDKWNNEREKSIQKVRKKVEEDHIKENAKIAREGNKKWLQGSLQIANLVMNQINELTDKVKAKEKISNFEMRTLGSTAKEWQEVMHRAAGLADNKVVVEESPFDARDEETWNEIVAEIKAEALKEAQDNK